jgi:dipeptidyl aminopeptidase/acylaminoacyl peptidase
MVTPQIAPYGSWKSPITSNLVVSEAIEPSSVANIQFALESQDSYWIEPRPNEGGRNVIVRRTPDGRISEVTPPGYNARTRVHEYGGGGFVISNGTLYFSNFSDQRVYRQLPGQMPWPITPALEMRYADGVIDQLRGRIICSYVEQGIGHIASLRTTTGEFRPIETPYTTIWQLRTMPGRIVFTGGSPTEPGSIMQLNLDTSRLEVLRRFSTAEVDAGYLSMPESIEFATEQGKSAYGFFYPPGNHDYLAPQGECPPLLVMSHGGPTAATNNVLDLHIQYWTSRGFAVLDVNYGGSTGYGRAYRKRLEGQWGIVDVDDCVNGAKYLAERGEVDMDRLTITGGSAGGYTTLCALTFRDIFKAGASHYGISDLEAMTRDTHKFESRYLDRLIGPYPERRDIYKQRSSINYTELLSCPVIFFQGLEDKVVPPNQAELMVEALRTKGLPVAYMTFEGEQHGFRRSKNIKRVLESEFYFYSCIFGFVPAEPIEPVYIENF